MIFKKKRFLLQLLLDNGGKQWKYGYTGTLSAKDAVFGSMYFFFFYLLVVMAD